MNHIYIIILLLILIVFSISYDLRNFYYSLNSLENNTVLTTKVLHTYNETHLGDHIFNTYFFNNIKDYLEKNNIIIYYYIHKIYHSQVQEFLQTNNVIIKDFRFKGLNFSYLSLDYKNCHLYWTLYYRMYGSKLVYNEFYIKFFNETSRKLKIPVYMNNFYYYNPTLLDRYENLPIKYKDIDILIINSVPRSLQSFVSEFEWLKFINKIKDYNFNIVTTYKIKNLKCTMDDNLTLKDIAAISTKAKIVIGVNTGPYSVVFNNYTLDYVKIMYVIDIRTTYNLPKISHIDRLIDIDIPNLVAIKNSYN